MQKSTARWIKRDFLRREGTTFLSREGLFSQIGLLLVLAYFYGFLVERQRTVCLFGKFKHINACHYFSISAHPAHNREVISSLKNTFTADSGCVMSMITLSMI